MITQFNSVIAILTSCACHCGIFCRDINHVPRLSAAQSNLISQNTHAHMHTNTSLLRDLFNQHTDQLIRVPRQLDRLIKADTMPLLLVNHPDSNFYPASR